jgi:polysaccharide biosynthesis protein PslH
VVHAGDDLRAMGIDVRSVTVPHPLRWGNCLSGWFGSTPLRILHCQSGKLLRQFLGDLRTGQYDFLHVDRFRMAPYAIQAAQFFRGPITIDLPDALSLYYQRAVQNPRNPFKAVVDRRENRTIPLYENELLSHDFTCIVCSEVDRDHLLQTAESARIEVIPHMVDIEEFHPRKRENDEIRLTFTGTLYYLPNIDGLLWFRQEVMPFLSDLDVQTSVVGFGATSELNEVKEDKHFVFTGYVNKMSEYLYEEDIYLCPIRIAAGVRNKLLEAFAAGMATVSTPMGYEGIPCKPDEHLLVANTAKDFADAVRYLLKNPDEKARLGKNAREFVQQRYSPAAFGNQINALFPSKFS